MELITSEMDCILISTLHDRQCSLGSDHTPLWRSREPSVPFGVSSMEVKSTNNRRHKRQTVPLCAWLEFEEDGSTRAMRSLDLSTEGGRFSTIRPVDSGDFVMVRLEVRPGAPAVECKGRVCWVDTMGDDVREFGVRFLDLVEDERSQIDKAMTEVVRHRSMATI